MTAFRSTTKTVTIPLKSWVIKSSAFFFLLLSLAFLFLNQKHPDKIDQLRHMMQDSFVPVVSALSQPAIFVDTLNRRLNEAAYLYQENAKLREENARLLQWQNLALNMQSENETLRGLVNLKALPKNTFVTARVVGNPYHTFTSSLLLDSGAKTGIAKYQAVVSSEGLVGRILESAEHTSRVMLITDINSRIPVITETSRTRAILTGNNSEEPALQYVVKTDKVKKGERVFTTSDGDIFPAGIPVGEVTEIRQGQVFMRPLLDFSRLEFVQAITPNKD